MKLVVQVIEARNLAAAPDLSRNVKLRLGKQRGKTKVARKGSNPFWDEEFSFGVADLGQELVVAVVDERRCSSVVGEVRVKLSESTGTAWYGLQSKSKKMKGKDCGEICLSMFLSQKSSYTEETTMTSPIFSDGPESNSDMSSELTKEWSSTNSHGKLDSYAASEVESSEPIKQEKTRTSFVDHFFQIFSRKNAEVEVTSYKDLDFAEDLLETSGELDSGEKQVDDVVGSNLTFEKQVDDVVGSNLTFDELLKNMESKDEGGEMPENLPGGVLVNQAYVVAPADLNSLLFSPSSIFLQSLADLQGTTGLQSEPWKLEIDGPSLKRVVRYTKAATKLVKAVKATEEQVYLKADGKAYAVLASVSTPDVPFGTNFKTEVLYCIIPGSDLPSGDQSSRLIISWRMNFIQSTMMKGMIENGARQGLKDSYAQFADLLSQNVNPLNMKESGSSKEQILASLQKEHESDLKLALRVFGNFTVISFLFGGLYILTHILLAKPNQIQGLEFVGLDLPDSVEEVVVCGVLVLLGERVLIMIARFLQARKQRGSDHGVKSQGDGWMLTVALIDGLNLAAVDTSGYSDPYVVFTCSGKTKTSSIKFQMLDPQWNEIFEFDAMDDPPSVMDVDVYDFDGPFEEPTSLGHAEVNFVKSNLSELADVWIPLQGTLAQACQSKLHLRIFLNNTQGTAVVSEYLTKMEKEVGKKINLRSPQTNSTFQKVFGLPPEEFLINDFTCHLKRKMPLQGRLYLSPRVIGFYTNPFGNKTKFYFLWEDIDDIEVRPPSLASMGSPSIIIILRQGRGLDAKHGAKAVDHDGRLKFCFQTFVSYNVAHRTIMALWKARPLSLEQKVQIVEEESEEITLQSEGSGSFLGIEGAKLSEVFSTTVPVALHSLMELFEGGSFERRVMEKTGFLEYSMTPWEADNANAFQRQLNYTLTKMKKSNGCEVTSTQQKSPLPGRIGWVIQEVMSLHTILLGDNFNLRFRYQIQDLPSRKTKACSVQVSLGIDWLKSIKHQKRITKNVMTNSSIRLKEMFRQAEKELTRGK